MPNKELGRPPEYLRGQHIQIYTPTTLKELDESGIRRFEATVEVLNASIEELRDMNGVASTDKALQRHKIISTESAPTVPTLQLWEDMLARFSDRTPFLLAIERDREAIGVCEGRIYPFMEERTIFIEQVAVRPEYRGNRKNNVINLVYKQLDNLAQTENVRLLIAAVHTENIASQRALEAQGFWHVTEPPVDEEGIPRDASRYWPHPDGAYLPNPSWKDFDSADNRIYPVLEYYTRRRGGDIPQMERGF